MENYNIVYTHTHIVYTCQNCMHVCGECVCYYVAQLTVSEVIKMGVASAGKGQRSPSSSRWLKVCGKDEYLDP